MTQNKLCNSSVDRSSRFDIRLQRSAGQKMQLQQNASGINIAKDNFSTFFFKSNQKFLHILGPLVGVQHLQHAERGGGRPGRERHPRVRLEGRVGGGLVVVH